MKKIIAISALMLFVTCGTSFGAALASGGLTGEGESLYGGPDATAAASETEAVLIGKMSKGVIAGVTYDETDGLGYAIATKHTSGSMAFGSADDSTAIYRTTLGTGALAEAPETADNAAFELWTEM